MRSCDVMQQSGSGGNRRVQGYNALVLEKAIAPIYSVPVSNSVEGIKELVIVYRLRRPTLWRSRKIQRIENSDGQAID
jgi:hypothetical protein